MSKKTKSNSLSNQVPDKIKILTVKIYNIMKKAKKEYTETPQLKTPIVSELDNSGTFMIVNLEEKWRIGMSGRWLSREKFETKEDAQRYIDQKPWELIMNLAGIVAEYAIKESKNVPFD